MIKEVQLTDLRIGDDVTVWTGSSGQGGVVVESAGLSIAVSAPGDRRFEWDLTDVTQVTVDRPGEAEECLEYGDACSGPVEMRHSGGMNGKSWPRCARHGEERLRDREGSVEMYADSDIAPSWFDPAAAGERWDDDY